MGEITEFLTLYLEDSGILEDKLDELSLKLGENIQNQLYYGHGRVTGNLRDSIGNEYEVTTPGKEAIVKAFIGDSAPYGIYVDEGHHSWEGYHFMEAGLEETIALYR